MVRGNEKQWEKILIDMKAVHDDAVSAKGDTMSNQKEKAKALLGSQVLAVLCTQGETGPYASLMAYCFHPEENSVFMVTRKGTKKYRNISDFPRVALLVDDRCPLAGSPGEAIPALTIQGTVTVEAGENEHDIRKQLGSRLPSLQMLLEDPESVLMRIVLDRFLLLEGPEKALEGTFSRDDEETEAHHMRSRQI